MVRWFHMGGPAMLWISALVLPLLGIAVLHVIAPRKWSAWAGLGLVLLVLACGAFGTWRDWSMVRDTAAFANPASVQELMREGFAEAVLPIEYAAIVSALAVALFGLGWLLRRRGRQ